MKLPLIVISIIAMFFVSCTQSEVVTEDNQISVDAGYSYSTYSSSSATSITPQFRNEPAFISAFVDSIPLRIFLFDFEPNHSDFENFDERAKLVAESPLEGISFPFTSQCYNQYNVPSDIGATGGNYSPTASACEDGYECGTLKNNGQVAQQTYFGEFDCPEVGRTMRFEHKAEGCKKIWSNPVYVSKGMVWSNLDTVDRLNPLNWVPVRNIMANYPCHNSYFDRHWYKSFPGSNIKVEAAIWLKRQSETLPIHTYDSKETPSGKFFPLDEINRSSFSPEFQNTATFGPQNLDLWCPPYGPLPKGVGEAWQKEGGFNESSDIAEKNACKILLANGGSRNPNATMAALQSDPSFLQSKLHNYGFTLMGFTQFKYNAAETFEFAGDGDMWIFVDGILVADLGGTHPPAEARLDFDKIAIASGGWEKGSIHNLHLFYAQRQTNSSMFSITTTLSELLDIPWGSPKILRVELLNEPNTFRLHLSSKLSDATLSNILSLKTSGYVGIIAKLQKGYDPTNSDDMDTLLLYATSLKLEQPLKGAITYKASGFLCESLTSDCLNKPISLTQARSLSFNYHNGSANKYSLTPDQPPIMNTEGASVKVPYWGLIRSAPQVQ